MKAEVFAWHRVFYLNAGAHTAIHLCVRKEVDRALSELAVMLSNFNQTASQIFDSNYTYTKLDI